MKYTFIYSEFQTCMIRVNKPKHKVIYSGSEMRNKKQFYVNVHIDFITLHTYNFPDFVPLYNKTWTQHRMDRGYVNQP